MAGKIIKPDALFEGGLILFQTRHSIKIQPLTPAMQPTLQEIADAAVRDVEARSTRRRRPARTSGGVKRVSAPGTVRIILPTPVKVERRDHRPHRSLAPGATPAPTRRYLFIFTTGLVLLAAGWLGLAWARASVGWQDEARGQRRDQILQQGMALHAQIKTLTLQAERLQEKSRILLQYSTDLRYSFYGDAGVSEIKQANSVLADRDRLLGEIAARRQKLADLREESAALYARP